MTATTANIASNFFILITTSFSFLRFKNAPFFGRHFLFSLQPL